MIAPLSSQLQPDTGGALLADAFGLPIAAHRPGNATLEGVRFAVKDVFDIAGTRTGAGNPVWRAERAVATRHATAVERLLAAGAVFVGKALTDELTYSLAGINAHYGIPRNPASPDRLPGGSSSGSVAAVASGLAEIALGTDCGGSVRLPASYCGVWGMRPTHGRLSGQGCVVLAHSFDTVGLFADTLDHLEGTFCALAHVEAVANSAASSAANHSKSAPACITLDDAGIDALLDPAVRQAFADLRQADTDLQPVATTLDLTAWTAAFRILQASEAWMEHGLWVSQHGEQLGADVRQRFDLAAGITAAQVRHAQEVRTAAIRSMNRILDERNKVIVIPTVPTPAPLLAADDAQVNDIRMRSQHLLCIAGLVGLPQISMPWIRVDGAPVGLSIIGGRGCDEIVLQAARSMQPRIVGASTARCAS
ncbi:amidase [Oxalicibacterium flavum]|uniref:Amidase n=1 Tax=Oxalicibacterium flavum TaxID=179467 RepID=A0A8J2UND3_9BURK|nr:amidase [Oxalicibacterium flavum]GGB96810.1 amidase [Oxalicibacterium flavum]